ncbi:histidinol dehydrogenase [Haloarcula nitratireducens]|uniref:Histidinol dehydrogenase n=1 Tax=Haloarcula nitratireducens TaxID=2487749 RepID=A0AAW4PJC4_9EURY|nr:histidinol dehydrogenase [Halomicroarcula nitratireducens]MBX0297475.1 histidinol dehydrogenase [Halomicroarcula nitratireducens]
MGAERTYVKEAPDQATEISKDVRDSVYDILSSVREDQDEAVRQLTAKFDGVEIDDFRVTDDEIQAAHEQLTDEEKERIDYSIERVRNFAEAQKASIDSDFEEEFGEGIRCGQRTLPVEAAGTYVPGGHFTHISSAPMSIVPARVAGVDRVITCTPPRPDGSANAYQLYAMDQSGADEIYKIGGAQAIGAMAYGTETVGSVDVVTGPGNVFVFEAKRQVFGEVDIDLLPGPTEVLIIADETADPEIVALDLLSQAEHTETSQSVLVTTDQGLAERTLEEIETWLPKLTTEETARTCWEENGEVIVVPDEEAAAAVSDEYAIEHVQIMTEAPREILEDLHHYGGAFLGHNAPVAFGDKVTGPDHILPTHGTARFNGGCWVGAYMKTITHQQLTPEGAAHLSDYAARISEMEGMHGHQLSAERRPVDE